MNSSCCTPSKSLFMNVQTLCLSNRHSPTSYSKQSQSQIYFFHPISSLRRWSNLFIVSMCDIYTKRKKKHFLSLTTTPRKPPLVAHKGNHGHTGTADGMQISVRLLDTSVALFLKCGPALSRECKCQIVAHCLDRH